MRDTGPAPRRFAGSGQECREPSHPDVGDQPRGQLWLTLEWHCANARHSDTRVIPGFDTRRDLLPRELADGLHAGTEPHTASHSFAPGEMLDEVPPSGQLTIASELFNRAYIRGANVEPRIGRFYPRALLAGSPEITPGDLRPCRLIGSDGQSLHIDLDHPLARRELTVSARLVDPRAGDSPGPGEERDLARLACDNGPGMQARLHNRPTDFFRDDPFRRATAQADAAFYAPPRFTGHVDRTASTQIRELYGRLLPAGGMLLDLMSSMQSHLPEGHAAKVTGLGMNREELDANPQLHQRLVHDLNGQPRLPFKDAHFDAAVCSLSVEYLVRPFEIFAEVARVLKPGAPFVVSFSDRWFPPKVIRAWEWAHPFERPGIVLEYFLRDKRFDRLHTFSLRGLPRPDDDKYAARRDASDPVFAVWGSRV